jgi:hypothetical protein
MLILAGSQFWGRAVKVALLYGYGKTTACGKCRNFGSEWKCLTDHKCRTEGKVTEFSAVVRTL